MRKSERGRLCRSTRWLRAGLGLVLAAALAWLALTPRGRATTRAGLFVLDILPQGQHSPLRLVTRTPQVDSIVFAYPGGRNRGHLYHLQGGRPRGAVVIALGYGPTWTDPLLMRMADDLARLGVTVLVPELPGLGQGNLLPEDVEVLVGAFEYLAARSEAVGAPLGFAGFCVGSSIALVAAADPRIAERVDYVSVFGGYYDLRDLMRAVASHSACYRGGEYAWHPTPQAVAMFAQNTLLYADNAADREALKQAMGAELPVTSMPPGMTPTDRLIYTLLVSREPATVDATIAALPAGVHRRLAALSPSAHMEGLRARVFVMHDVSDPYVPVTESYRLADALASGERLVYARFSLFEHVYPSRPPERLSLVTEGFRLFLHLSRLMGTMVAG